MNQGLVLRAISALRKRYAEHSVIVPQFSLERQAVENRWFGRKVKEWQRAGRLTQDGVLKIGAALPPWTWKSVGKSWPHLQDFDRLAVLITADGFVEGGFMDAHTNIREVIEEICDIRISRIFGNILMELRQGPSPQQMATTRGGAEPLRKRRRHKDPETGEMLEAEAWDKRKEELQAAGKL